MSTQQAGKNAESDINRSHWSLTQTANVSEFFSCAAGTRCLGPFIWCLKGLGNEEVCAAYWAMYWFVVGPS